LRVVPSIARSAKALTSACARRTKRTRHSHAGRDACWVLGPAFQAHRARTCPRAKHLCEVGAAAPCAPPALRSNMKYKDLEESALKLNGLYEELEIKLYGRVWTTEEIALGFVGDVGDLAKLIQANAGIRKIDDFKSKL